MFYRFNNALSERHYDENGYLFVERSPILKAGVMEYLGSELLPEGRSTVDGVQIDPQKIYRVNVSLNELKKAKDTFKLAPITDGHIWLGDDGADAKNYQEGTVGENLYIEDGFLYAPLSFTGKAIVEKIKNHKKEELSTSYQNKLVRSTNPAYDFDAVDIRGNHLALVDRGRAGSDVRVLNSIKEKNEMAEEAKLVNEAILELDGERIDLNDLLMNNEAEEGVDKRKIIDEVGGMLKDKVDEELWRTIIGKLEKLSYDGSEDSKQDNKCKNEEFEEKEDEEEEVEEKSDKKEKIEEKKSEKDEEDTSDDSKSMNYDAIYEKVFNSLRAENEKIEAEKLKAYNSVRGVLGDFNPFGMTCKDMYVKGLNHLGVSLDGSEKSSELASMFKACASVRGRVDNGFDYNGAGLEEEIEINL
ncbi:MAG: DUF2213 domain-containing protein [Methanobrevibacter sp.]|nr:DUF2213 domain-containing protein [Methanobrevibacter sp.]